MQRELDKELIEIKQEIRTLRDKVVSAKAMMSQAEIAISNHLNNISQMILDENAKTEFKSKSDKLSENLSSEESAKELFDWIESYVSDINDKCAADIDKLKEDIAGWKQITS